MIGIAMPFLDDYIINVLMRDLVGHDYKPTSFLVYLWLSAEQTKRGGPVQASYQELAESVGISKSSAQSATNWLLRRKLITATRENATATPVYAVHRPWSETMPPQASR